MKDSKNKITLFSALIALEICIFFLFIQKTSPPSDVFRIIVSISNLFLFFLALIFFLTFLLSFIKNAGILKIIERVYTQSKFSLFSLIFLIVLLFVSSSLFFLLADGFELPVYQSLSPYALFFYFLAYELLILLAFTHDHFSERSRYWLGLPLLLAANYFLRHTLEQAGAFLQPHLPRYFAEETEIVFSTYKWWQFMLPIKELSGLWSVHLVLAYLLEKIIGTSGVWYLFQAILIVTAFFLSWKVFRSKLFSYFLALCLGFSTHLYHMYQISGGIGFYVLTALFLVLMYLNYRFIISNQRAWLWIIIFIPFLVFTAIYYESWLDYFAAVWLVSIFLFVYFKRNNLASFTKRLGIIFAIYNIVAAIYIYIKFTYVDFAHTEGIESDLVFNYHYFWPIVEDIVSNYFSHMYITLTNFLPPPFITSNSLYYYSAAKLIEQQFGYHPAMTYLVPYHYMFLWRYFAGALTVIFIYGLVKVIKEVLKPGGKKELLPLALFMLVTAADGPTHTIIKIRPMNTMPVLGYHVLVGVLGFSLTISYLTHLYLQRAKNKKIAWVVLAFVGVVILYSSIARPKILWHMIEQVGLDVQGPYPNPIKTILPFLHSIFPTIF